jgi:hypothetical protein
LKKKEWIKVLLGSKLCQKWAGASKNLVTAVNIATKCIIMICHQLLLVLVTLIAVHKTIVWVLLKLFAHKIVLMMTMIAGMLFINAMKNTEMLATP